MPDPRVEQARALARLLDSAFRVPGTRFRFGLDPILGLIPGLGDVAGGALSAWILYTAARLGAPPAVIARMALRLALDTVVGWIPLLGDLFDARYKANLRNLDLLERWMAEPGGAHRSSMLVVASVVGVLLLLVAGGVALSAWAIAAAGRALSG